VLQPCISKKIINNGDDFKFACVKLECKLGLAFGSLQCKEFLDVLQLYKGNYQLADIPNRNLSKKITKNIYEQEKLNIKKKLNESKKNKRKWWKAIYFNTA